MITQCQACPWGAEHADFCEKYHLPYYLAGEECEYLSLSRRFGVRCCATCKRYGPDADEVCICHVYQCTKSPRGYCDEWEAETQILETE